MYIIENVTDREGLIKKEFIDEMKQLHPNLEGEILYKELLRVGNFLCFAWNDDSEKMLRTTPVVNIQSNKDIVIIETKNSVYYLKEK